MQQVQVLVRHDRPYYPCQPLSRMAVTIVGGRTVVAATIAGAMPRMPRFTATAPISETDRILLRAVLNPNTTPDLQGNPPCTLADHMRHLLPTQTRDLLRRLGVRGKTCYRAEHPLRAMLTQDRVRPTCNSWIGVIRLVATGADSLRKSE